MKMLAALVLAAAVLVLAASAGSASIATTSYAPFLRVSPFAAMPLPDYNVVNGATVAVEYGFVSGSDTLMLDYEGSFPINATFSSANGVLYIQGLAPVSEYAVAIQSVVFATTAQDGNNRQITFSFGQNVTYATSTEHFYRYVYQPPAVSFETAQARCAEPWMGMTGYLATITTEREMAEVCGRTLVPAWLGAKFNTSGDGAWRWTEGPEGMEQAGKGRPFWTGGSMYAGGAQPSWLSFDQWFRFEPTNGNSTYLATTAPAPGTTVGYFTSTSNTDGIAAFICEYGGLDSAAVAAAMPSFTGSTTLVFDCTLFSADECRQYTSQGCAVASGKCVAADCSVNVLQRSCLRNSLCGWYTSGEVGVCANTQCAALSGAASCATSPVCKFVPVGQMCVPAKCSDKATACACTTLPGCSWRSGGCRNDAALGCNGMDVLYLLDSSAAMMQPFGKYPMGFFALTESFADADLSLTGKGAGVAPTSSDYGQRVGLVGFSGFPLASPPGTGSAGGLTGDVGQLAADVAFLQRSYNGSSTVRRVAPSLNYALSLFAKSTRPTKVLVIVSAGQIDDLDVTGPVVSRLAGVTVVGVVMQPTEPATVDSNNAYSALRAITPNVINATATNFYTQVTYGLCMGVGALPQTAGKFVTSAAAVIKPCSALDQGACFRNDLCAWDPAGRVCATSGCLGYCNAATCNADISCTYSASTSLCRQTCASQTAVTCSNTVINGTQVCMWVGPQTTGYCSDAPCISNPSEDACIADTTAICQFNPSLPTPCTVVPCQAPNQTQCVNSLGCAWNNDFGCFQNPCRTTNLTKCALMPQCTATGGVCAVNDCARQFFNEQTCMANQRCNWITSVSPPVCGLSQCGGYMWFNGAAAACALDATCYWQPKSVNGFGDTCAVKTCDVNLDAASCTLMSQCVWRNGACKDGTFVQCPMIDVVFLVEATPVMGRAFGRHPNGFMGIVEAIRTWSKSAPLSPSIVQSGFRLAIVGYGSPVSALQPAEGLGGKNFTADINQWAGISTVLDNFIANQPLYAETTAGLLTSSAVSMFEGLQAAKDIFKRNANTSAAREKLLFVLGHSPINDGATLQESMTALETTYNVQIFGNLMTRFSALTTIETVGGALMAPLASVPQATHFAFQTIDQLIFTTLNTFCDPTTNVGKAIGVSSNGILPCNWLRRRTSCEIQGSCSFNRSLAPTCPLPGQCPNLGCAALPVALATQFTCQQCRLVGGAFACDRGTKNPALPGVCASALCMYNTNATCNAAATCAWDQNAGRCVRKMCTATTAQMCIQDLGCVWVDAPAADGRGTGCVLSQCGLIRDQAGCLDFTANALQPCAWNTTANPPICVEKRCQYLSQATCTAAPFTSLCAYSGRCTDNVCLHSSSDSCNADATCYWDPFAITSTFGQCSVRGINCVMSRWSPFSPCSASCGPGAYRFRSRSVLVFPTGGTPCPSTLQEYAACNTTTVPSWNNDCTAYCTGAALATVSACIADISCQWQSSACVPKLATGCASLQSQACEESDMCTWLSALQLCTQSLEECQFASQATCVSVTTVPCIWRTGTNDNAVAAAAGTEAQLLNPGQLPIHPFANLVLSSSDVITAATVMIENGYVLGKDILLMTYPDPNISASWSSSTGLLTLTGSGSVTQYANAIRSVTFQTNSLVAGGRNITWSFGSAVFSVYTQHHYAYTKLTGVAYADASRLCGASSFFGLTGYLTTISSPQENAVVTSKLMADGWAGGQLGDDNSWVWNRGLDAGRAFWFGGNVAQGGYPQVNAYANWNPLAGEPKTLTNMTTKPFLYVQSTGFWAARYSSPASTFTSNANGYVCEYRTKPTTAYPIGGAVVIGVAGCVPQTPCIFHKDRPNCDNDPACLWSPDGECVPGCATYSSANQCGANPRCTWSTATIPPICLVDTCPTFFANTTCTADGACAWNGTNCLAKSGCAIYTTLDVCNQFAACAFVNNTCGPALCGNIMQQAKCTLNPLCAWSNIVGCTTACKYTTATACSADGACQWGAAGATSIPFYGNGQPVQPFATGTQSPLSEQDFVDGITVTVSAGFQPGQDVLWLSTSVRNAVFVTSRYDSTQGALFIDLLPGRRLTYVQAYAMVRDGVNFFSVSSVLVARSLSYVLSSSTIYSAGSFFKVAQANINNGTLAASFCAGRSLFGLQGSLARIPDQKTNFLLTNINAQGFIGGVNRGDNSWFWVNNGLQFWQGAGAPGVAFNGSYAQFPDTQPVAGNAFATLNTGGVWGSVPTTNLMPLNVICQFGSQTMQPSQVLRGTVVLAPQGCFASGCTALSAQQCGLQPLCAMVSSAGVQTCARETWCSAATSSNDCGFKAGCYWSFAQATCRVAGQLSVQCLLMNDATSCALNITGCTWNPNVVAQAGGAGACVPSGCGIYPTALSCGASPACRWFKSAATSGEACIARLCGYQTATDCLNDILCAWVPSGTAFGVPQYLCQANPCSVASGATACAAASPSCQWSGTACVYTRCSSSINASFCMTDTACLLDSAQCVDPDCSSYIDAKSCNADDKCIFGFQPPSGAQYCQTSQCFIYKTIDTCQPPDSKQCVWNPVTKICKNADFLTGNAPKTGCPPKQGSSNPNAIYALVALVIVTLLLIFWRLYLAFAKGMNFLSPSRNTKKFTHNQYAADLIEDAQNVGEETNDSRRPNFNDL